MLGALAGTETALNIYWLNESRQMYLSEYFIRAKQYLHGNDSQVSRSSPLALHMHSQN
jgi:hypothetical protein